MAKAPKKNLLRSSLVSPCRAPRGCVRPREQARCWEACLQSRRRLRTLQRKQRALVVDVHVNGAALGLARRDNAAC